MSFFSESYNYPLVYSSRNIVSGCALPENGLFEALKASAKLRDGSPCWETMVRIGRISVSYKRIFKAFEVLETLAIDNLT